MFFFSETIKKNLCTLIYLLTRGEYFTLERRMVFSKADIQTEQKMLLSTVFQMWNINIRNIRILLYLQIYVEVSVYIL